MNEKHGVGHLKSPFLPFRGPTLPERFPILPLATPHQPHSHPSEGINRKHQDHIRTQRVNYMTYTPWRKVYPKL